MSQRGNMATLRLKQDYIRIMKDPVPYVKAHPLPSNILEWHFAVTGPEDTPYKGGIYHGKLVFPSEFPFKPPSIYMITPNGRFKCNTRLCLSISDFHPDTWNPAWSVSTILTGLLSFMVEKNPTLGSIETTNHEKRILAMKSIEFNLRDPVFCELFEDLAKECTRKVSESVRSMSNGAVSSTGKSDNADGHSQLPDQGQAVGSAFTNLVIVLGFAVFAYTVKCVVMSIVK